MTDAPGRGMLDCDDMKKFWVSWGPTSIDVGEGLPDTAPFMQYQTHSSTIDDMNAIGFAGDAASVSVWKVFQEQGTCFRRTLWSLPEFDPSG